MECLGNHLLNDTSVAATSPALEIPKAVPVPWNETGSDLYAIGLAAINNGLNVFVDAYSSMDSGDKVEIFWNDTITPLGVIVVTSETVNQRLELTLPEATFTDGIVEPFYRIKRISGAELESRKRTIRVKLKGPGGRNPDPTSDYNANLRAPQLSGNVAKNGVDADQAAKGVDVTIPPWPNMTEYDRIDFRWGGVPVTCTVQPAEVAASVTLHVDEITIQEAGDGQTLLMYRIIDLAANRSDGWSMVTEVDVFAGSTLDVPIIVKADGMTLDVALLNGQGAGVNVLATSPHFAVGDTVELLWAGHPAIGADISWGDQQTVTSIPQVMPFFVPSSSVAAVVGGTATISYTLLKKDGTRLRSKHAQLMVVNSGQQLPAPLVREAVINYLRADAVQATVEIADYRGMSAGDVVTLKWIGLTTDGQTLSYTDQQTVVSSQTGKTLTFVVPGATQIAPFNGGQVTIGYWVTPADNSEIIVSASLVLQVGEHSSTLNAPVVAEALDNILQSDLPWATVSILPYEGMTVGDNVRLSWVGDISGEYQDELPVSRYTLNQTLPFRVYAENIAANTRVEIGYLVERISGGSDISEKLTLSIAGNTLLAAPTVDEAKNGVIAVTSLGNNGATARIPASAAMQPGDLAILSWTGITLKRYSHVVTGREANNALLYTIPLSVVQADKGKRITLEYEVVRSDNTTDNSAPSAYDVHS